MLYRIIGPCKCATKGGPDCFHEPLTALQTLSNGRVLVCNIHGMVRLADPRELREAARSALSRKVRSKEAATPLDSRE